MAIIPVVFIAFLSLRDGFSGDQALFLIYSKAISNGAILYRDVWDIKQPGILVFYLLAGKIFGFTEVGVHLLEIIYWLIFSVIMVTGLRHYFRNPTFALLTPIFTIGIYYSVSGSLHYTQAESLVCFPLFMSLWFCQKILENPDKKRFAFYAGLFGGLVVTFKLMFVLILLSFWFCLFAYFFILYRNTKQILVSATFIFIGLLIPLALVVLYFAQNNALDDLWYATFVFPYDALRTIKIENRSEILQNGLIWFFKSYFPVICLTLLFLFMNLRFLFNDWLHKIHFTLLRKHFIFSGLFIWVFTGFFVILIQKLSWWEYHYSLLMVPLGILSVKCLEEILKAIKTDIKHRWTVPAYISLTVLIILLFIPTRRRLAYRIHQFNQVQVIKIGTRELLVTGSASEDYKTISADTAFLRGENPKTAMFVLSNPLYYYLSDLQPVISSNGAMPDMFTDTEWTRLNREMSEKSPKYIFIDTRYIEPIRGRDPSFIEMLNKTYFLSATGKRGSFYRRIE